MRIEATAIVCALRVHGEHGAIVRLLTRDHGLVAAYVRGARGRTLRPVLIPGNIVQAALRSRNDTQLPQADIELCHSRAPLFSEPLPAAAIAWVTALTATALPEGQPYPRLHDAFDALLAAIEAAPSASGWGAALVRYELLMLAELGFGLNLDSVAEAEPYTGKLLKLPAFITSGGQGNWQDIADGLDLTGHFLRRDLIGERWGALGQARDRLVDQLRRAGGI